MLVLSSHIFNTAYFCFFYKITNQEREQAVNRRADFDHEIEIEKGRSEIIRLGALRVIQFPPQSYLEKG